MGAFQDAQKVESRGIEAIAPYLSQRAHEGRYVMLLEHADNEKAKDVQKKVGDVLLQQDSRSFLAVELKFEVKHTGNLFLETWSDKAKGKSGWLWTMESDELWYCFLDKMLLYPFSPAAVKQWVAANVNIKRWKEVEQTKYKQRNQTCGLLVPVTDLMADGLTEEVDLANTNRPGVRQLSKRLGAKRKHRRRSALSTHP